MNRQMALFVDFENIATSGRDHGGFEHGHTLYGEILRVPLVLAAPGVEPGRVAAPVQHADLFRTILGLSGVAVPAEAEGTDLRALAAIPRAAARPLLSRRLLVSFRMKPFPPGG